MDLGFDTIGNATLIAYDRGPVLVTDPWVRGSAYFGSWVLQHEIPDEQRAAIAACPFVWFSHGHPDHLNPDSVALFRDRTILLPDHRGGRIADALRRDGHRVQVLEDRVWTPVSERVRVFCMADRNQDAVLLVDVGGRLVVDVNDAQERGSALVRRIVRQYPVSFLLRLSGYGGADMANYFDEDGERLPSPAAIRKANGYRVGEALAHLGEAFGSTYVVPFSSMHRYQRGDSVWANESETELADYGHGFRSDRVRLLPAYLRYNCGDDTWQAIEPASAPVVVQPPEAFGDSWSDELERSDVVELRRYFSRFEHLGGTLSYLNFRVGGSDNFIDLPGERRQRGITFEAPRHSLMMAVRHEIFDDLLIANFMRTTLHGSWPRTRLYPEFTPFVAKFGDNGRAHTDDELSEYLADYRGRLQPMEYLHGELERRAAQVFRGRVSRGSAPYQAARKVYWLAKGRPGPAGRAGAVSALGPAVLSPTVIGPPDEDPMAAPPTAVAG